MSDDGDRDERLGDALRKLEVPEHRPDFFPDLMTRLEGESRIAGSRRRATWSSPKVLAAVAASVFAVALAASVVSRDDKVNKTIEPQLITASAVRARVATALASLKTLKGEITVECEVDYGLCSPPETGGRTTKRWSFAATASGDERVTGIGFTDDTAFSATDRVHREIVDFGNGPEGIEVKNPGAGPPDSFARSALRRNLASIVRAFITDRSDVAVTEVMEAGREAWRLSTPVVPNKLAGPGRSGDRLEVVVDRQSGFPLRITESLQDRFLHEVRLSNLSADVALPEATFTIDFPAGARVFRQDAGFRRVSLDEAARVVGYEPLVPTALPKGFVVSEVLVATKGAATGNEAANPEASGVVSVAFRRGFDRVVVTSRLRGPVARCTDDQGTGATACWADPLASGEGNLDEPERVTISQGVLHGDYTEFVLSPRGVPHIWSIGEKLVVTIAGDASGAELLRLAESMS